MRRICTALLAALVAATASGLTSRTLSGKAVLPDGVTVLAAGSLKVEPAPSATHVASTATGVVVGVIRYTITAGNLVCTTGCSIATPASYKFSLYGVIDGRSQSVLEWSSTISDTPSTPLTMQDLYTASTIPLEVAPDFVRVGDLLTVLEAPPGTTDGYVATVQADGTTVAFEAVSAGDIEGVTAGAGLTGGGTTGTVSLAVGAGTGIEVAADTVSVASTQATDAEVATAVSDHAGAADPHTGYRLESVAIPAADLPVMVGDTGAGGVRGAVGAPAAGDASKFWRGDATWQTVSTATPTLAAVTAAGASTTTAITLGGASPLVLDGATAGTNATTITVTDPSAANVLTVPDASGTLALTSDIPATPTLAAVTAAGATTATGTTFTGALTRGTPITPDATADTMLAASSATQTPLVIQGAAAQSVPLQEWQTSAGAVVGSMTVGGALITRTLDVNSADTSFSPISWIKDVARGYLYADTSGIGIADGSGASFNDMVYLNSGTDSITFYTNGAAKAVITSTGDVTVGGGYAGGSGATVSTAGVIQANGAITSDGVVTGASFSAGASPGMTTVVTVRDSGGAADCTMTFTGGILTATTCSHT